MSKDGYIVGIGAANVDLCGRSREPLVMEDSNPGSFTMSIGGVTRNICENAAGMGAPVKLITVLGDDLYGQMIRDRCADCGIDISHAVAMPGHSSSTYLSIHEPSGEMAIAMSDMSILQRLTPEHLMERREVMDGAAAIVIDGGLPQAVVDCVLQKWGRSIPVFADPVSTAYARKFLGTLVGCHTIKPNALEAEVLTGVKVSTPSDAAVAARKILELGARRTVITMGAHGAYYLERGGEGSFFPSPKPDCEIVNATGAGDCLTGGLLYGYLQGMEPDRLMKFAMTAATITITSPHTIHPQLRDELVRRGLYTIAPEKAIG